jgi:hypothetical protein
VHGIAPITKEVLIQRTTEYKAWVEAFARDHGVPIEWAEAGVKKEDHVRPYLERFARRQRVGVYFIFRSREQGPKCHVLPPKAADPLYRLIRRMRGRYTHFYFYIRDDVLGPFVMCVGSYLPFQTTYYLNGHHFIAGELERQGIRFRRDDNAFWSTADATALQTTADRLTADVIRKRPDYWTRVLGPKFSAQERAVVHLRREYSLNQVEYSRNFVFRRHFPIHQIFERSCDMGLFRLTADTVSRIFGVRVHKRLRGKLSCVLDRVDHGHHVMRVYCKSLVARLYEEFSTFLRVEICVNRLKDLGLNKGLTNLEALRQTLALATDRLAGLETESLNVHVDFPLFQRLALPVTVGHTRIPGIKLHDTRMIRLMEVLLHAGT